MEVENSHAVPVVASLLSGKSVQDPGFDPRRGCAVFFRLIRRSVLLSLSELKGKIIFFFFFLSRLCLLACGAY